MSNRRLSRLSRFEDSFSSSTSVRMKSVERIKTSDGEFISCFFTKAYVFSNHFTSLKGLITIDGKIILILFILIKSIIIYL